MISAPALHDQPGKQACDWFCGSLDLGLGFGFGARILGVELDSFKEQKCSEKRETTN
jgi:hypothetical protein